MVMHDVQNKFLLIFYQLGTLSPLPSGEKEVSQTPHCFLKVDPNCNVILSVKRLRLLSGVTTLFRDFTGGLSLVPLITFYSVESFIAGVRETQGNISKAFIYQK